MEEYRRPYYALFSAVTKAIEKMELGNFGIAKALLVKGQQTAEEIYIQYGEDAFEVLL
ncbi:MAG: hypothetical protein ACI3VU_06380 [Faecousia sp.]